MSTIDDLATRLALLEDERAILHTLNAYGHSIDYGAEEAWVDCFTDDGVFDVQSRLENQQKRRLEGKDALRKLISGHTRPPERWHKHILVEPLIEFDDDAATCRSYFFALVDHEGRPTIRVMGRYLDRLQRCGDGHWRIKVRVVEVESVFAAVPPFAILG